MLMNSRNGGDTQSVVRRLQSQGSDVLNTCLDVQDNE